MSERLIPISIVKERNVTLKEFLSKGLSFKICRDLRRWPTLEIFNSFLQCGVDDIDDELIMNWEPFDISDDEYQAIVKELDSDSTFDSLGIDGNDWKKWLDAAVRLLNA